MAATAALPQNTFTAQNAQDEAKVSQVALMRGR
jgi:hypothetical protein